MMFRCALSTLFVALSLWGTRPDEHAPARPDPRGSRTSATYPTSEATPPAESNPTSGTAGTRPATPPPSTEAPGETPDARKTILARRSAPPSAATPGGERRAGTGSTRVDAQTQPSEGQAFEWDKALPEGKGIVGSKHDFSRFGWSRNQICLPCHTPHRAGAAEAAPLWDRGYNARGSYTLYTGREGTPGPATLVCLSCHDGSTALDAYGGMIGGVFMMDVGSPRSLIGRNADLRRDHPVGIRYPEFNPGFRPRIEVEAEGDVVLPGGRVECLSCHDVHNQYGVEKFLVKSNERSALCLTCHRK